MKTLALIKNIEAAFDRRSAGDFFGALNEFELLERLSDHPQDIATLRFFQATCLTDMGQPDEALGQILRVDKGKLPPAIMVDYEYERARIERAQGHLVEALDHAKMALKLVSAMETPHEVSAVSSNLLTLYGILLSETGRLDEAIPILTAVPRADDGWAEARVHLGDCKYKKRLYKEAIDCYLSLTSDVKQIHQFYREAALRNIGYAHYDLGEYQSAIEYLNKVEHAYDDNPSMKAELFDILSASYLRLGKLAEAERYRNQPVILKPSNEC